MSRTEITFSYPAAPTRPVASLVRELIEEFERGHPAVRVRPAFLDGYEAALDRALDVAAGTRPDVGLLYSGALLTARRAGAVAPLDTYVAAAGGQAFLDDFLPGALVNTADEGRQWALPFQKSTYLLFYNRAFFAAAGLDPAAPPETWEALVAVARRLTVRRGGQVTRWGLELPEAGLTMTFQALVAQQGVPLAGARGTAVFLDTVEACRALQALADLSQRWEVTPAQPVEWYAVPRHFAAGRTAMMIHSTSTLAAAGAGAAFPLGAAFLPRLGQRPSSTVGGGDLYLFPGPAERQEAAWTLLAWLVAPEQQARFSVRSGYMAVRRSAWATEPLATHTRTFPPAAVARDQLAHGAPELMTYAVEEVRGVLKEAILAAMAGRRSAADALGIAQARAEKLLAPYRRGGREG